MSDPDLEYKIRLDSGQIVYLEKLIQTQTYSFLRAGRPNKKINDEVVDALKLRASNEDLTEATLLLPPERKKHLWAPGEPDTQLIARSSRSEEWLPRVSSIAVLYSIGGKCKDPDMDGKSLTLCFFQDAFGMEEVTKQIQSVDWDKHAVEFQHWYT